ncbi:hypothetical protein H9Q10_06635 [Eikenella sp. S3360]|uniref:Lipoprotein n=1 Tax=Eikenella glucosivorans TaxID=2766967 RepID=A0ABS0NAN3_9NEIS|nr:hypothetical protein [Eikenella glucosivorans]MBH5329343.1 hypothetical protein [Eikenella glucosivorans]
MKNVFLILAACVVSAACAAPNPPTGKAAAESERLSMVATPETLAQFRQFCPDGTPVLYLYEHDPRFQYFQVACRKANGEMAYGFGVGLGR